MDNQARQRIRSIGGEAVCFDVPMSQYTTFRVGGKAEAVFKAESIVGLRQMVAYLADEGIRYLVIGRGSNLLVADEGIRGMVILLAGDLASVDQPADGQPYVKAGGGAALNTVVHVCAERGLAGLEFLAGIPGTLGGGLATNAGAWGKEIKDVIGKVTILTAAGAVQSTTRNGLRFHYRGLDLPEKSIIVEASLCVSFDQPSLVQERVKTYLEERKVRQPHEARSAGSVFKNPEGDYAGRLIEAAGLKGKRVGGAMVSTKHANYIVNTGGASAADIMALMDLAVSAVKERFRVELTPEIRRVGP
ncbi:MAG: UDP-N-acetylmuramate dehydrogenase [Thermodesulfobacteriota bacterium]